MSRAMPASGLLAGAAPRPIDAADPPVAGFHLEALGAVAVPPQAVGPALGFLAVDLAEAERGEFVFGVVALVAH